MNSSAVASNYTLEEAEVRPEIPYYMSGSLTLSAGILLMGFYMHEKCHTNHKEESHSKKTFLKESATLSSCSRGSSALSGIIFALLFVHFFSAAGVGKVFMQFMYSFAIETGVAFSRDAASLLQTTFWVCAAGG